MEKAFLTKRIECCFGEFEKGTRIDVEPFGVGDKLFLATTPNQQQIIILRNEFQTLTPQKKGWWKRLLGL